MALVGGSRLIILDEPTSSLDYESRLEFWALVKKIKGDCSIIMSTQDFEEADELSDRICILSQGKEIVIDTPFDFKKKYDVGYNILIEPNCDLNTFAQLKESLSLFILKHSGIE